MGEIFKDIPNKRSSHTKPKLKSGGIFFISFILIFNIISVSQRGFDELSLTLFLCTFMGIIGLIDDLISLSPKIRYVFQLIISFLILQTTQSEFLFSEKFFYYLPLIFLGPTIINLLNFMDGMDGLLIGCTLPLLIYTQIKSIDIQIFVAIASMISFLKWNWNPSKLFMGDCGSNFLGSLVFYILISNNDYLDYKAIFIIFPLLLDSSFCILRRFYNKENIFLPHKKHLYQRLYQAGLSHGKISSIYIFICLINFIIITNKLFQFCFIFIILELFIFIYLDKFIAKKYI